MYDDTDGVCCSRYGVPKEMRTMRACRACSLDTKSTNARGAPAVAVVELMFTYEPSTMTSTESAMDRSREKSGATSSELTNSGRTESDARRISALNATPA